MSNNNKLNGILLVGGRSTRMGTSKAQLCYRDKQPEWQRLSDLMKQFCDSVYLVCQQDQAAEYEEASLITDSGDGPLAAIASANQHAPGYSWLVIACDLPLLDASSIKELVDQRDSAYVSTYFSSVVDDKPEPLCAIYENHFFSEIDSALSNGHFCPRHLLMDSNGKSIELTNIQALKNANTPAEKMEIEAIINDELEVKKLTIRYFAQMREISNMDSELRETTSVTPAGLYEEIQIEHKFPHKLKQLMVAVNGDFTEWDTILKSGDEIAFIPPVAGG